MAIREPEIIRNKDEMRNWSLSMKAQGKTIGSIPSTGYLHQNPYDYGEEREGSKREKVVLSLSCLEAEIGGRNGVRETWIRVERLEKQLCGKSRPAYFRGIATGVAKGLNIIQPDVVVYGKKDYQQWRVVQRMALSISRSLFEAKSAAKKGKNICSELKNSVIETIEAAGGKIDYVEIVDQESLEPPEEITCGIGVIMCVEAWFGKVRLIDNIEIEV